MEQAGNQVTEATQTIEGSQTDPAQGFEGEQATEETQAYTPFANGKEKFVVDGEELEMDWDEVKKSVQLAKASYKRFEEATQIKTSAQKAYEQMMHLAKTNPEGLIRVLNPNWQSANSYHGAAQHDQRTQETEQPWQTEIERLAMSNRELAQKLEHIELEKEKNALMTEFGQVQAKYPIFKDKAAMAYLKLEYRKALKSGMDTPLEDVAFYVNQDLTRSKQEKIQSVQSKVQQQRQKAPVSAMPASSAGAKKEFGSFEDVRKSLGLA